MVNTSTTAAETTLVVKHGPIACLACFPLFSTAGCTRNFEGWRVDNNPGYWGAANPEVLVLGFSKGANQRSTLPFDKIGFNGARNNLREILEALKLLVKEANIDDCFTETEPRLGFASVIRCGVGKQTGPEKWVTSGDVIVPAIVADSPIRGFFEKCTERYLGQLPKSVRTVVFLGIDPSYVEVVFARVKELYPSLRRLSELAYATDNVVFVHAIHPSPLATSHRQKWLLTDSGSLPDKRREVLRALYGVDDELAFSPNTNPKPVRPAKSNVPKPKKSITLETTSGGQSTILISMLNAAVNDGSLRAEVIGNRRTGGSEDIKKLLRLKRYDGQQFAVEPTRTSFWIWSSVQPDETVHRVHKIEYYPVERTRHSNLECMVRLRGPNAKRAMIGVRAWKVGFNSPLAAFNFISETQ